jgi:hypothetical protein
MAMVCMRDPSAPAMLRAIIVCYRLFVFGLVYKLLKGIRGHHLSATPGETDGGEQTMSQRVNESHDCQHAGTFL